MTTQPDRSAVSRARRSQYWASATTVAVVGTLLIWKAVTARHPNYAVAIGGSLAFVALIGVLSWALDRGARRALLARYPGARVWAVVTDGPRLSYLGLTADTVVVMAQRVRMLRMKRTFRVMRRSAIVSVEPERVVVFPRSCPGARISLAGLPSESDTDVSVGFVKLLGFGQATAEAAEAIALLRPL